MMAQPPGKPVLAIGREMDEPGTSAYLAGRSRLNSCLLPMPEILNAEVRMYPVFQGEF
jgi:hypothetical protein